MIPHDSPMVAIGVPSGDLVHTDFAMSLAMLCMNPGEGEGWPASGVPEMGTKGTTNG